MKYYHEENILKKLILKFSDMSQKGTVGFFEKTALLDLILFFENDDNIEKALEESGIKVLPIKANHSDKGHEDAVRLATMHRGKGLEFDEVILASVNSGLCPLKMNVEGKGDEVEARQADTEERSLVYVSMTRAKKKCLVLSYGTPSPYVKAN